LDPSICVIADDRAALGIAGIMGGEETGCTEDTTNVFIECAWFDPDGIAAAGRKLGIVSDARYRFERHVDPEGVIPGIELAARLVSELCGGTVYETAVAGHVEGLGTRIAFPLDEVRRLTGLNVPREDAVGALTRLGFTVEGDGGVVDVTVPSWRPDVTQ